jgi:hypothetical protein
VSLLVPLCSTNRLADLFWIASSVRIDRWSRHAVLTDPREDVGGQPFTFGLLGGLAAAFSFSPLHVRRAPALFGTCGFALGAFRLLGKAALLRRGAFGELAALCLLTAATLLDLLALACLLLLTAFFFAPLFLGAFAFLFGLARDGLGGEPFAFGVVGGFASAFLLASFVVLRTSLLLFGATALFFGEAFLFGTRGLSLR